MRAWLTILQERNPGTTWIAAQPETTPNKVVRLPSSYEPYKQATLKSAA
jgi:hypothetical protein